MTGGAQEGVLPAEVRQRLVAVAAEVIGKRPPAELPPALRRFAKFTTSKRVRMGANVIAAALSADAGFRQSVAETLIESVPELVEQIRAGNPPATADPVDVAAIAYLTRPDAWREIVDAMTETLAAQTDRKTADARTQRLESEIDRLSAANAELARARQTERADARSSMTDLARQITDLERRLRIMQGELRAAQRGGQQAAAEAAEARAGRDAIAAGQTSELRKTRARVVAVEAELDLGRRAGRTERDHDAARLWLLLEQITNGAAGLRRELDLDRPGVSPADLVAATVSDPAARLSTLDGSNLDKILDGVHVHLIVDGYNITKTGYGTLPLADQRSRLASALGALAARTKVEVTVAFDGTAAPTGAAASLSSPRGVRVLFSAVGQLADDLVRDLLDAEPAGRTVIVASSDQAVAASARGAGAWSVTASVLLSRLERA